MNNQIIKLIAGLQEQVSILTQQVTGLSATHQIVLEILLSQSPQQKQAVAQSLSQILEKSERVPNTYCLDLLRTIQEIANNPSRTSPEGRRGWLNLVSQPNSDEPKPSK
ncbi:MAG: hypothetical protein KAT52_01480 [Desulfobacterales bacterium]|nr:hypothetical protein [Desulfobacterales bacterium]